MVRIGIAGITSSPGVPQSYLDPVLRCLFWVCGRMGVGGFPWHSRTTETVESSQVHNVFENFDSSRKRQNHQCKQFNVESLTNRLSLDLARAQPHNSLHLISSISLPRSPTVEATSPSSFPALDSSKPSRMPQRIGSTHHDTKQPMRLVPWGWVALPPFECYRQIGLDPNG